MTNLKVWNKPSIEVAQIKLAKGGSFSTSDLQHTHRS